MGNVWYSGWEDNECYHHSILEKHRSLLEKMIEDRIFSIGFYNGKFLISEECDEYYSHALTKKEAHELSELFHELGNSIKERVKTTGIRLFGCLFLCGEGDAVRCTWLISSDCGFDSYSPYL